MLCRSRLRQVARNSSTSCFSDTESDSVAASISARALINAALSFLQLLLVPRGRFVAVALARDRVPELLERAELLFPGQAFDRRRTHRPASLRGATAAGKRVSGRSRRPRRARRRKGDTTAGVRANH